MKFYLELTDDSETYRLQKDDSWRKITEMNICDSDYTSTNGNEVMLKQKVDSTIELEGKKRELNSTSRTFGQGNVLDYNAFVLRKEFPETPSKEQLVATIKNGNDSINNSLVLNVNGLFELRNFNSINLSIQDPTIVMRNETFGAGNEYVGESAANHIDFINDIYSSALEYWYDHLKTGATNMYSDSRASNGIEHNLKEIEALKTDYKPNY